jgi:hypothetical protein
MTTTTGTGWKSWSTNTRLFVGVGALAAIGVVVFLYTT